MADVKKELKIDGDTILYLFYLLYKGNILTRNHLKHLLKIIKEPVPGDIAKFLVEEVGKAY